jgi:hypothetical protein
MCIPVAHDSGLCVIHDCGANRVRLVCDPVHFENVAEPDATSSLCRESLHRGEGRLPR